MDLVKVRSLPSSSSTTVAVMVVTLAWVGVYWKTCSYEPAAGISPTFWKESRITAPSVV